MATKAIATEPSYQPEAASLFYCEGNSDKVYSIQLTESEAGWSVAAQWGRRGSTLQAGSKIERAGYDDAKRIFDKTLSEKAGKGYQYVAAVGKKPVTGITAP